MRKRLTKLAQVAGISLALGFVFGCGEVEPFEWESSISSSSLGGNGGISSITGNSSSSNGNSSDNSSGSLSYQGKTYKIIKIDDQIWMAENFNYKVEGSKCYGEGGKVSVSYDEETDTHTYTTLSEAEIQANCDKYGQLYDWTTAMNLPSSCNTSSCSKQITAKHRGICPFGWHIPSNDDWNVLMKFVNPNCEDNRTCVDAGTKLKATNGWNSYVYQEEEFSGNGTDDFEFSALPGGEGNSEGNFANISHRGTWWSSSEYNGNSTYSRGILYGFGYVFAYYGDKSNLLSVRCVQD